MKSNDITYRCLALTGSFETSMTPPGCFSGLAGDFDKQGLSFGALQWNLGQGTLQPMLATLISEHPEVASLIFADKLGSLKATLLLSRPQQLQWARSIQAPTFRVTEPWKTMFGKLGQTAEFQAIQVGNAQRISSAAQALCQRFEVMTERAYALMFDIVTQNGGISDAVEGLILQDYLAIPGGDPEVPRLRVIANRRAEASNKAFVEDVRRRKLCIANGAGTVHGVQYNLETQFGLGLEAAT